MLVLVILLVLLLVLVLVLILVRVLLVVQYIYIYIYIYKNRIVVGLRHFSELRRRLVDPWPAFADISSLLATFR